MCYRSEICDYIVQGAQFVHIGASEWTLFKTRARPLSGFSPISGDILEHVDRVK